MARSKQPAIKREASSEFFNKTTATWEDTNQSQKVPSNGNIVSKAVPSSAPAQEAGLLQLVIAVAGIYASL
jgi:solute carrier family 35 (UDP-galactose transporter), member B1